MKSKKITLSLIVVLCAFNAEAKMYKCTDSKGNVSYSSSPCKEDQKEDQTVATNKLQMELNYNSRPETKEMFVGAAPVFCKITAALEMLAWLFP